MAFINRGLYGGAVILAPETVEEMLRLQIPEIADFQALAWRHFSVGDTKVIGHAGGEQGALTMAFITEDTSSGVILLSTGDGAAGWPVESRLSKAFATIYERLLQESLATTG